jgi:hypothetical protein
MGSRAPYRRALLGARAFAAATALLLVACSGADVAEVTDASAATASVQPESTTPAPPTTPPPAPPAPPAEPPPPPEPVIERMVRTLPGVDWDPEQPIRNAAFQRFDSLRHQEVGQTLEVTEAFELHRISVWFSAPSVALPGFREIYFDGIDWSRVERFVQNGIPVDDLDLALSIVLYRSPDPEAFPTIRRVTQGFAGGMVRREREVIPVAQLEVVSDQRLTGTIRAGEGASHLDLTESVLMEPGRWLVALRIDRDESGIDIIDLPIHGWESGRPPDIVIPSGYPPECTGYTPADDPTPGLGFYWRDRDPLDLFIPGAAKVGACAVMGRYDNPMGPGDIGLDLWGFPAG